MKHYREIDILRGIAIIMVFLGHAVIVYPINLENVAWCRGLVAFISAVHMPLFFIVAGFCFHRKSTYVDMVQKKIKRLLVPYVIFNLFDMCCRLVLSKFVNRPCGIRESMIKMLFYGGEYWFLYVLFLMCILWGGILPYVKKHVWLQVIVGIAAVVLNVLQISFDVCKVDSLCRFFVFFYAGFLIQIYFDHLA
jgi:acyltransferase 3